MLGVGDLTAEFIILAGIRTVVHVKTTKHQQRHRKSIPTMSKVIPPSPPNTIITMRKSVPDLSQTWHVMGEPFDLPNNFKVVDYLGAGAYGKRESYEGTCPSQILA